MIATRLTLRDFRTYGTAAVELGPGLTVVTGRNGAGKTNLLEGLYFACTGRSCRTGNERECVRFGAQLTRLELRCEDDEGQPHEIGVGFQPGEAKRLSVDGAAVDRLTDVAAHPLVSVFLPDRLELVTGTPALRRAPPRAGGDAPRVLRRAGAAQCAGRGDPRRPRRPVVPPGLGRRARQPRDRPHGGPRGGGRRPAAAVRRPRRAARPRRRAGDRLPPALPRDHGCGTGGRARGARRR